MSNRGLTVAKNAGAMMAAQFITTALTFVLSIVEARYLGPEQAGQYILAASLWAIVGQIVSFGMDTFIVKTTARDRSRINELFSTSLVIRAAFMIIGYITLASYSLLIGYSMTTFYVVLIIGVAQVIAQYNRILGAIMRGIEQMQVNSLANIAFRLVGLIIVVPLLLLGYQVVALACVLVVTNLVSTTIFTRGLRRYHQLSFEYKPGSAKWMLKESLPFLMTQISRMLYVQVDIVVISWLVSETAIGWYGVADRVFGNLLFVSTIFSTAIFPMMVRKFDESEEASQLAFRRLLHILIPIGVAIGIGVIVVARPLMTLVFGEQFANSGPVLAVYGVVIILMYPNTLIGHYMFATDRQNQLTWLMTITMLLTIPLDFLLVPWTDSTFGNGAIGGALAYVFTETFMLGGLLYALPKKTLNRDTIIVTFKTLVAGGIMGGIAWFFRDQILIIPVAAGVISYAGLIFLLRVIPQDDMKLYMGLLKQIVGRRLRRRSA